MYTYILCMYIYIHTYMYTYIICMYVYIYLYMAGKNTHIYIYAGKIIDLNVRFSMCDCQRVCMIFLEDHSMISEIWH